METNSKPQDVSEMLLTVGPWRLGRALGEGASGRVCLGKHQKTGRFAAIKVINKTKAQGTTTSIQEAGCDIQHAIEREIVVMNIPTHPNMIELYEIWDSRDEVYLVLEYVSGGDLLQYMTKKRFLPEKEVARLFKQLITGLSHLHRFSIYHRDLKHENLMMDQHGNVKIGDFGMAALQPAGKMFTSACGSPNYAAPEVVQGLPYNGSAADIWSSGVILYGMLTHQLPFDDPDTSAILSRIVCAEYKLPRSISFEAGDLIKRILELDPAKRIKLEKILEHPFITKYQNLATSVPLGTAIQNHTIQNTSIHIVLSRVQQVDMDIVAKLKALWMTQDEAALAKKVLFQETSLERLFYDLLLIRHVGGQPAQVSSDIILNLNTTIVPPKLDLDDFSFTKVDRRTPFLFWGTPIPVELGPKPTVQERAQKFKGPNFPKTLGDEERLCNKALGSNNQPEIHHSVQSPLAPLIEKTKCELEEYPPQPPPPHAGSDDRAQLHIQPVGEKKSALERRVRQLNIVKACLEVLSSRNIYKRKVRRSQSRRSVIFTGSQLGVGNAAWHRLPGLGKQIQKTNIPAPSMDVHKVLGCLPTVGLEKPHEGKLVYEEGVAEDGTKYPRPMGNGSHDERALLALLNRSQRKQTVFSPEPVTKTRRRFNSILSIWQSYGAGHVRMDGQNIVWRDAMVTKGSRRPFACMIRLVELNGGTVITVSRERGPAARLSGIVAEFIELLFAHNIRGRDEDADGGPIR
ncbi:hypothetical protein TWF703_002604 [Orbilia oligospora]|uniref:Protein kinase domain-containing protein n=1 Tax=Orbilia oligospora TaxID=2813651 RepID=A0A7C8JFJ5_ORBOL|nr:hypothetical protein TWF703_002604 [Orbilia oligospora]